MKLIEEYKRKIKILTQENIKDGIENTKKLLKNDYDINKINKEEYRQLLYYIEEIRKRRMEQEQNEKNEECRKEIIKFKESLTLKVKPIYKGEYGKVAPARKKEDKGEER